MTAIVDCFRVSIENCGNDRVKYSSGGQMKRRRSRTHVLDIPSGMQRNLSESHLVQAGSLVSNVAGQFSKLGHSLNPKILTGKKPSPANAGATEASNTAPDESTHKSKDDADNGEDSLINTSEISESTAKYNDNSFLQSVGIVMVDAAEMAETQNQSETRKSTNKKNLENVARISISSVTDNVKLPPEMLDINDIQDKADKAMLTPEINVEIETDDVRIEKNNGMKMCHSVADMRDSASSYNEDGTR